MNARNAQRRLRTFSDPSAASSSARFFKKEHVANRRFLGLRAATLRQLAREFRELPLSQIETLLRSDIHEGRALALLILDLRVHRADDSIRKQVYDFYLANIQYVDSWDLVDVSAGPLVGAYLNTRSRRPLHRLARSLSLWERRIAIVATQHLIRQNDFTETLKLAEKLLHDEEDLIHKAVGWMLREVGKRHRPALESFLKQHAPVMPRTMLRYAIERFPQAERLAYLKSTSATQVR
ncbi:MAG TPA: DNA alkylation repair protein [Gemmataceae bacterium]|nr:DNA alkylation repair protein [Gemmataceae bacterium]